VAGISNRRLEQVGKRHELVVRDGLVSAAQKAGLWKGVSNKSGLRPAFHENKAVKSSASSSDAAPQTYAELYTQNTALLHRNNKGSILDLLSPSSHQFW
jgi:hypothetical protein